MNELPVISGIRDDATIDHRVELILDLTRRLELLDDLLIAARARRRERDTEVSLTEMYGAGDDAIVEVQCGHNLP